MVKITVGIPVYNGEKTIACAVRSVLCQSYGDFELIISDDGSTDGTLDIVRSFDDERIRIVEGEENRGVAYRQNEQIQMARGEYYACMDADDIMFPNRLKVEKDVLDEHLEIDVVGSAMVIIDENGSILGGRGFSEQKMQRVESLNHATIMGRTEWFRANPYNEQYRRVQDYELWVRTRTHSYFCHLGTPLLYYCDPTRVNLRKCVNDRLIGNKVLINSVKYVSSKWKVLALILNNYFVIVAMTILYVLRLDSWVVKRRCERLENKYLVPFDDDTVGNNPCV